MTTMELTSEAPRWQLPKLAVRPIVALLPLLALPFVGYSSRDEVIFLACIILLAGGLQDPIYALCALVLSDLTMSNAYVPLTGGVLSNRLFLSFATLLIVLPYLPRERLFSPRSSSLIIATVGFFVLANGANTIVSGLGPEFGLLRFMLTGILFFLYIPLLLRTRQTLLRFVAFGLGLALLSSLVGILQVFGGFFARITLAPDAKDWWPRVMGLSESPIYLSNDLLLFLFAPLALMLLPGISPRIKGWSRWATILIVAALFFSGTRSWVIAFVPTALCLALLLEARYRRDLIAGLALGSIIAVFFLGSGSSRYVTGPTDDKSAASRPVLWTAGYLIARDYPIFGIGYGRFASVAYSYRSRIPTGLVSKQAVGGVLGTLEPHQDFLNIWDSFGTVALIAYSSVFLLEIQSFVSSYRRSTDPMLRAICLACLGAIIAYIINSSFHNFFETSLAYWVLAGLAVALSHIIDKDEEEVARRSNISLVAPDAPQPQERPQPQPSPEPAPLPNVLLLANELKTGGAERQLLELARGLDKTRFNVWVMTLYPGGSLEKELAAAPGINLVSLNRAGKYDFLVLFRLAKWLSRHRIDVIQPYLSPATFFALSAGVLARTPVLLVTERSGANVDRGGFGSRLYAFAEERLFRFARAGIANSEAGRLLLRERGLDRDQTEVIYNGVSPSRTTADPSAVQSVRDEWDLAGDWPVIGIVARLDKAKDHATLLKAVAELWRRGQPVQCVIVGEGEEMHDLIELSDFLGIAGVTRFTGNQAVVAPFIATFDVAVLCSHDIEGCSNFLLEAMAMSKPLVATNIGGNREVVRDGVNGFLVPIDDPSELANALAELLDSPEVRRDFGANARADFDARFRLETMVRQYEELYLQTIGQIEEPRSTPPDRNKRASEVRQAQTRPDRRYSRGH